MNKKHLSVVMAGAMLATSVAPVLAATETTVNESERGNLIKRLRELVLSKSYSDLKDNDVKASTSSKDADKSNKSVYCVEINNVIYDSDNIPAMEEAIKRAGNTTTIKVYNRGFVEEGGFVYNHTQKDIVTVPKMDEKEMRLVADSFNDGSQPNWFSSAILGISYDSEAKELKVKVRTAASENEYKTLIYKEGDAQVHFAKPVNSNGKEITGVNDWADLAGFVQKEDRIVAGSNIPTELVETITLTDVDKSYDIVLSDVYDGLFLTSKGEKLFDTIKEYEQKMTTNPTNYSMNVNPIDNNGKGLYSLSIEFVKTVKNKETKQVVNITTNKKDQLNFFANGIAKRMINGVWTRRFPAQILAGENRFATAVKIAKENADITTVAENGNIVLVNGNALVDGLAAAPLAASVVNEGDNRSFVAPILLTNTNGIPAETKAYMREIIGEQKIKNLDKVTVYLVGGEAVISPAVEKDLKEIGFRVVRAGGKDREATSLAVAKLMNNKETTALEREAFVVGADGEADAMSIASVAAATNTPIIVESRHGISNDTIEYIKGYKFGGAKEVTVVGGENVVSKETEAKLAKEVKVERVAGKNRQETNAEVIDTYYGVGSNVMEAGHRFNNVVVSKDGQKNKSELIDALTATSLAVRDNAPIVLATNKLSSEQINVLEKNADRNGVYVYQIGNVARDVVKTIASRIGLAE